MSGTTVLSGMQAAGLAVSTLAELGGRKKGKLLLGIHKLAERKWWLTALYAASKSV